MEKIFAKPHTPATYPTVIAVIDGLVSTVLPKLTDIAVVLRRYLAAVVANLGCLLGCSTEHTEHVLGVLADERVVLVGIMAEPTGIPLLAGGTLQLHVPLVVLTS